MVPYRAWATATPIVEELTTTVTELALAFLLAFLLLSSTNPNL